MKTSDNQFKRILCPVDFSETSIVGLEYAGKLAQAMDAALTVFYIGTSDQPEAAQLYADANDSAKGIRRQLHLETKRIAAKFGINCDTCVESTAPNSQFTIGEASSSYDLTVLGTNGSDSLYDHIFGTGTHHRLGLAKCPVLLVPPGQKPRLFREIIYAFDPETNPQYLNSDLETLGTSIKARIRTLYIVPEPAGALVEASQFPEAMIGVHDRWGFDWDLDPISSDEIVESLDRYMKHHKNSVLALSCHHRALFESLFQDNVMEQISRLATYPVLVFWH